MALIRTLQPIERNAPAVHEAVEATYLVFRAPNGESIVQINSLGREGRQNEGEVSQSIQITPDALIEIIRAVLHQNNQA